MTVWARDWALVVRYLVVASASLLASARSDAQPSSPAPQPSLIEELSSAPHPGQSGASASFGWQLQNGRTETHGWTLTGVAAHSTPRRALARFDVSVASARYRATVGGPSIRVEDKQRTVFTYLRPLSRPRFGAMGVAGWRRDAILGLDYRAWVEGGLGFEAVDKPTLKAFLGTSLAVGREGRSHTLRAGDVLDVGALQTLNLRLSPTVRFEEWFKAQVDTTDSRDRSITLEAAFVARVVRRVGMRVSYSHQYDSLVPPGSSTTQSSLSAGAQITFAPTGGASAPFRATRAR